MLMRGVPQRRQSEGNNVANKPAAIPPAQETHGLSCATTPVPVARIGFPLLLKAILPRPAVATGAPTRRIFFSIAMRAAGSNEHKGRCHLVHIARLREAYTKASVCAKVDIPLWRTKMWRSKFLSRPWFWGYLHGALVLN
jgi:hypothetical protein